MEKQFIEMNEQELLQEMRAATRRGEFESKNHAERWARNFVSRDTAYWLSRQLDLAEVSPPSTNNIFKTW